VPSTVAEDREEAFAAMRGELVAYFSLPFYRAMIERSGYADDVKTYDAGIEAGDVDKAKAAISDRFLENLTAIGSDDDVRGGIERYREAGATSPCVGGIPGGDVEATFAAVAELL
jgi:alkanesulfonate monooxygenase SsuD/methylene tetrahydromethanopterin reductase-like flavin-dependent oxidoreductase (luciferase family)